jgi:hypothetical protein
MSKLRIVLFALLFIILKFTPANTQENQPVNNISFESTKYMIAPMYMYQNVIVVNTQTIFGRAIRNDVFLDYNFKDIHGIDLKQSKYDGSDAAGIFYLTRSGPTLQISDLDVENNVKSRLNYISRNQTAEIQNIIISTQSPSPGFCLGKVMEVGNFWFLQEGKEIKLLPARTRVGGDADFASALPQQYFELHKLNFQYIHNAAICLGTHSAIHPSMSMSNADMRSLRDVMLLISGMWPVSCNKLPPPDNTREKCEFVRQIAGGNR